MTTRRTFLTQAGVLSAGMLIGPGILRAIAPIRTVGLQLYSLRNQLPKDVKGVIAKVAAAGYKEVETYGYTKAAGFWGLTALDFSKLLKDNGLTTPSGHFGMEQLLSQGKMDDIQTYIEAAKITGMDYLTMPHMGAQYYRSIDEMKKVAEKMNLLGELCKKSGLRAAYHNHNFEFAPVDGVMMYDVLLSDTDPKLVDFQADLYWVARANQDPISIFEKHPGRFAMVHVKDMDKNKREINTEVGKGSIDFTKIMAKAKKAGVKHFIVEQENFSIDPYESITESCSYIKKNLAI